MTSKSFQNIFVQQVKRLPLCPLYGQCWLVGLSTGCCLMVGQLSKKLKFALKFLTASSRLWTGREGGKGYRPECGGCHRCLHQPVKYRGQDRPLLLPLGWTVGRSAEHTKNIICYFQLPNELFYVTFLDIVEAGKELQQSVRFFKKRAKIFGQGREAFP